MSFINVTGCTERTFEPSPPPITETHRQVNNPKFSTIILAGDRSHGDPVAGMAQVSGKSIVPLAGIPMIVRVIEAIEASNMAGNITICGPAQSTIRECPALQQMIDEHRVEWLPPGNSPCSSAAYCIDRVSGADPVFLTTADHGLLNPDIIGYFLKQSAATKTDATVGLVDYQTIVNTYPASRRTRIKFQNGSYCGCNLFSLFNDRGKKLVSIWKQVEEDRKHPFRILGRLLGPVRTLYYLLGRLTLEEALRSLEEKYNINTRAVILPYPAAGIDVDSVADFHLVESILSASLTIAAEPRRD